MNEYKIRVTQSSIDNAIRNDSHRCMIQDSIQRQMPWAKFIMVDSQSIRFSDFKTGKRHIYLTPPNAQQALIDWDAGKKPKPFTVTISQGFIRAMRVMIPGYLRSTKKYPRKEKVTRYMPLREREFGLRKLKKVKA